MNNLNDDDFNENLNLIMGARKLKGYSVLTITHWEGAILLGDVSLILDNGLLR